MNNPEATKVPNLRQVLKTCGGCHTCALVPGTVSNDEPQNVLTSQICVLGGLPFWCHNDLADDWQGQVKRSPAENVEQIRSGKRSICHSWRTLVSVLNETGYFKVERHETKALAAAALRQLGLLVNPGSDLDTQAAARYTLQVCYEALVTRAQRFGFVFPVNKDQFKQPRKKGRVRE